MASPSSVVSQRSATVKVVSPEKLPVTMVPESEPGLSQFDLPLSFLAPGGYGVEISAAGATDRAKELVLIRVTD